MLAVWSWAFKKFLACIIIVIIIVIRVLQFLARGVHKLLLGRAEATAVAPAADPAGDSSAPTSTPSPVMVACRTTITTTHALSLMFFLVVRLLLQRHHFGPAAAEQCSGRHLLLLLLAHRGSAPRRGRDRQRASDCSAGENTEVNNSLNKLCKVRIQRVINYQYRPEDYLQGYAER